MDWLQVILGGFAAGGLFAALRWLQSLLAAPGAQARTVTPLEPGAATEAATRVIVAEYESDLDELNAAIESDSPESVLADILNSGRNK